MNEFEGALEQGAAVALLATIEAIKKTGVPSQKALRLGAFVLLEGALGREVWKLVGIPPSTARRWRAEVRKADASGLIPSDVPAEFQAAVIDLIGAAEADAESEEANAVVNGGPLERGEMSEEETTSVIAKIAAAQEASGGEQDDV